MLPIRCFTCNKILGRYNAAHQKHVESGQDWTLFFDKFKITRYCCQKIFMTHIDVYEYNEIVDKQYISIVSGCAVKKIVKAE